MPTKILTPTITGTVSVAPIPTPAATPTPPVLQNAKYPYDGDDNLVKKVNPDGSRTLDVGAVYEVEKNAGGAVTHTTLYYPAGGAMRVDGTLYTVLGDQLGSTSVTLDAAGDVTGEMRYYPFGETRLAYSSLFTDRLPVHGSAQRLLQQLELVF